ncbi:MAG: hypothetical protein NDI58_02010 [Geothrix sp.]|nr:hypothetical protein [Geothrix sp.]
MLGRVKDAMADAAETLRRAFSGLKVVEAAPARFVMHSHGSPGLQVEGRPGLEPPQADPKAMVLLQDAVEGRALEPFHARLAHEAGWTQWAAGATVVHMEPLEAGRATKMAVPPLPRRTAVSGRVEALARPVARRLSEPLARPAARRLDPGLGAGPARPGLETMLTLAVPFQGEDVQRLPQGLWMRYSLQLVRGTGENVRNLEVLGLFRIPRKGVADLRHDARQGRILLRLEPAALAAARSPFVLARRKDDGALVSCFVEDP